MTTKAEQILNQDLTHRQKAGAIIRQSADYCVGDSFVLRDDSIGGLVDDLILWAEQLALNNSNKREAK
ncbi:MAG: hypothetical protein GY928_33875 [Colwellia sp.]|nr:hypothetical protein [Colwellia sp.]